MNKNTHPMNDIINDFTEKFGDNKVQMTFRDVKEGMDSYFSLISMTADLIKLIREEETLRKHHRAYLHVREDILESSNELMAVYECRAGEVRRRQSHRLYPQVRVQRRLSPSLSWMRTMTRMLWSLSQRAIMTV